jgi:uncharacterized membrane protein
MGVTRVPRTFGILSIVFASIVLVSSLFGVLGLMVPALIAHAPPPRPEDKQALEFVSRMYTAMGIISVMLAVMSGALLALGIGQLRYRQWAHVWTVRWGIVALGVVVIMAIVMAKFFTSSIFDVMAQNPNTASDQAAMRGVGNAFGAIYASMIVVFYAPYPILLMIFFSRRHVRAAMTA